MYGRPICNYGFPCVHMFCDDDGDPFCGHPFTHAKHPDNEKDWENTSVTSLTCDMHISECPLNLPIMRHIEDMMDTLCEKCYGSGKTYTPGFRSEHACPECLGTGLEREYVRVKCTDCGTPIHPSAEEYRLRKNPEEHSWEPICMDCFVKMVQSRGGTYGNIEIGTADTLSRGEGNE